MIFQGGNRPIDIYLDGIPADVSVLLHNNIGILKHWTMNDLIDNGNGYFQAPITQEESLDWEEGPCFIDVKWTASPDDEWSEEPGVVQFTRSKDEICRWMDTTMLVNTIDIPAEDDEEESEP